jgi:hypothetical protein
MLFLAFRTSGGSVCFVVGMPYRVAHGCTRLAIIPNGPLSGAARYD